MSACLAHQMLLRRTVQEGGARRGERVVLRLLPREEQGLHRASRKENGAEAARQEPGAVAG